MLSNNVRQRLLEEDNIDLAKAFTQARALETAESQSLSYTHPHVPYNESCALHSPVSIDPSDSGKPDSNLAATIPKCFFCGYNKHPRSKCPPKESLCHNCNKVGHFQRGAYHPVQIREDEKLYTDFEACSDLYQFCRIPFGVTNGVVCFQRLINNIITKANLKDTFAYVNNVTICGQNVSEHNINYGKFLNAVKEYSLTFNEDNTTIAAHTITLLGFQIPHGVIKPDPGRFRALRELPPPPPDLKSQQRTVGMFVYYSNWISHFSDKIHNLIHKIFPLPDRVKQTFQDLKLEEVELLDCNPQYAHVRLPNGKEETVSVKHLAPREEPDDLGTSECLADVNDLIEATEVAHEMYSNDEVADSPTPTNYELLKQNQQRLHPYNLRSREAVIAFSQFSS
ncbi:uncharacterized protein DEA37_0015039 [Paragonimus westermani]|uniref:Reverse transcriptase domain-containing protein n=1 Tax=Paragonimus westermani TaxID=34504 RepID=A0A5J4NDH5_9TREM|nr:uncharacterized protein DEA37_0015039 [Paragonimus westermani]